MTSLTSYNLRLTLCSTSFNIQKFCVLPKMHLFVLCASQNKQLLFHYTAFTDCFFKPKQRVFTARYRFTDSDLGLLSGLLVSSDATTECTHMNAEHIAGTSPAWEPRRRTPFSISSSTSGLPAAGLQQHATTPSPKMSV